MNGRTVVITGATSGIGQVAAESLAQMGAKIVQVARDRQRAEAALQRLRAIHPQAPHTVHYADLSLISETKRVAAEIALAEPRIDVLINNAGAMFSDYQATAEGLERTFALNHMSYFVLTLALRERLMASGSARVVCTSSDAHASATLDFDDLQSVKAYANKSLGEWLRFGGPGFKVYGRSKLCNILFTRELARRLSNTGITANCLHPGFVNTRFGDQSGGLMSFSIGIAKRFALTPQQGAETLVYLASSPEIASTSGLYFAKCRPATPAAAAQDDAAAQRLWQASAKLAGILPQDAMNR